MKIQEIIERLRSFNHPDQEQLLHELEQELAKDTCKECKCRKVCSDIEMTNFKKSYNPDYDI